MNILMRIDVKADPLDPQHVSFLDPDPKGTKYQQKIVKKWFNLKTQISNNLILLFC